MKAGDWKVKGIRRGFEKGTRPVYMGNEDVKHIYILLTCPKTKECSLWTRSAVFERGIAYRTIINCINKTYIKFREMSR
jgi:hypothetical protein